MQECCGSEFTLLITMFLKVLVIGCLVVMEMSYVASAPQGCNQWWYFCGMEGLEQVQSETPLGYATPVESKIPIQSKIATKPAKKIPLNKAAFRKFLARLNSTRIGNKSNRRNSI